MTITPSPKPAPRPKKAPKPIARKRARPRTLTLAQRKARRPGSLCARNRCHKVAIHFGLCGTHATAHLDDLQRRDVVHGECEAAAWHRHLFRCSGAIQVNHVLDRCERLVKYDRDNVLAGCAALNTWAFRNKRKWWRMFQDWRGDSALRKLEAKADSGAKFDHDAVHAALHAALGESVEGKEVAA